MASKAGMQAHPVLKKQSSSPLLGGTLVKSPQARRSLDEPPSYPGKTSVLPPTPFQPPPLPRCSQSGMPRRLEQWKTDARQVRLNLKNQALDHFDIHGGAGCIEGFRAVLRHKHHNAVRGWRLEIVQGPGTDKIGAGPVTFNKFCLGLKRLGFSGNATSLWRCLSKSTDGVRAGIEDLDPDLAAQFDDVARVVAEKFPGTGSRGLWAALPRAHRGRATAIEFEGFIFDVLQLRHFTGPFQRVFNALDLAGNGTITRQDLRFLDEWAARRLGEPLPRTPTKRVIELEHWLPPPKQPVPEPDLAAFRMHLEQRFGSCGRAWRSTLDPKGTGSLSLREFGVGCRAAGWRHSCNELWRNLIDGNAGATLRALDHQLGRAADKFAEGAGQQYGDIFSFWVERLDPTGVGAISRAEFVRELKELGVEAAAARHVCDALDVAGTGWVAVTELGWLERFAEQEDGSLPDILPALGSSSSAPALRPPIWSSTSSTRCSQSRAHSVSHGSKNSWLRGAVMDRSFASLDGTLEPEGPQYRHRQTPKTDIFRTTNEFYREGMQMLMDNQLDDPGSDV